MKCFAAFTGLVLLFASCAGAEPAEPGSSAAETLAQRVNAELERRARADNFSGAVILEIGDTVVLDAGYGYADREADTPFTTETIAQIGSITKIFTGLAIVDLAQRGRVAFDAPVSSYLPDAPEPVAAVTLDQLLTHTAGTGEYCGGDDDDVTLQGLYRCLAADLRFEPGTDHAYSNTGYQLLAAIVERVSGRTVEAYLRERILDPNDMEDTGYVFADAAQRSRLAAGYSEGMRNDPISERLDFADGRRWSLIGAGGMQASARDMLRLKQVLAGEGSLSQATLVTALEERYAESERLGATYTFNQLRNESGAVEQFSFAGSDGIFFAYFRWRPEDRQFFYFVGNNGEDRSTEAVRAVMAILSSANGTPD